MLIITKIRWHGKWRDVTDQWRRPENPEVNTHVYGHLVSARAPIRFGGKRAVFSVSGAGPTGKPRVKECRCTPTSQYARKSPQNKDLNVIKPLKKKPELCDLD